MGQLSLLALFAAIPLCANPCTAQVTPPPSGVCSFATSLPAGYQTPGFQMDVVIDLSNYTGSMHPVEYALTDACAGLPALLPLPPLTKVGVALPAGQYSGFSFNDSTFNSLGPEIYSEPPASPSWGDIEIHLVGPFAPKYAAKQLVIQPAAFTPSSGDTVSIYPSATWPARLRFWCMELRSTGRKIIGHSGAVGVNQSPVVGSSIHFYACDIKDYVPAPGEPLPVPFRSKWILHTYFTSPWLEDCIVDVPSAQEHAAYPHNLTQELAGMRNCDILSAGGQIWQEVCRDNDDDSSGASNYEGPWLGTGTTLLESNVSHSGFHKNSGRASYAFSFYSTGRDIVLQGNVISDLDPTDTVDDEGHPVPGNYGLLLVNEGAVWNDFNVYNSRAKVLGPDGAWYHNKSLTVLGNVFAWKDGNRPLVSISSVAESTSVSYTGFYNEAEKPLRLALEGEETYPNTTPPIPYLGDLQSVAWFNNNTGGTKAAAVALIPGLDEDPYHSDVNLDIHASVTEGVSLLPLGDVTQSQNQRMVHDN